jgi:17beta-estradiol 17-dehydrogenase / very-long-chain 3-oxoacyl-CoA reductase
LYFFSQFNCCQPNFVEKYGKWAVISGSTDGIGQSMAKELARRGMSILVVARNEEKLANTKAMLEQEPNVGDVETVKIDLSDSSLENFNRIRTQIDPDNRDIGVLINNAGFFPEVFQRYNRFDMQFTKMMVDLNVLGVCHLTRMIMPGMVQRGKGLVMNVSSGLGLIPAPYLDVYGPTKAFINSFTRQLQMEYASHPLDIVLLSPGPVVTKQLTATSKFARPSIVTPSSDDFAKSVINAWSTGIQSYAGCMMHQFMNCQAVMGDKLGLLPMFFKHGFSRNAKEFHLSPVPRRKRVQTQEYGSVVPAGDRAGAEAKLTGTTTQ